ncbi:vWA domain-containing protein [Corynebacterium sp. CCM 9203]|uniref:vWA domain-containing protein n=1 Tax=Corynebacterium sp. CCM 9203 TaxID=3057615 RepID=UPI003526AA3C
MSKGTRTLSELLNRNFFAGGVAVTIKHVLALISVVALLVAVISIQVSDHAFAEETDNKLVGDTPVVTDTNEGFPSLTLEGTSQSPEADKSEEGNVPSRAGNAEQVTEPNRLSVPLPVEYEEALANWPADEADEFRRYYRDHPNELELIDVARLRRDEASPIQDHNFRLSRRSQNPGADPSKECGLNVAIVIDVSSSVNEGDPNGINKIKKATKGAIDQLSGNGTKLGLYNFANNANMIPEAQFGPKILTPDNATQAKKAVDNLRTNSTFNETNWEDALKQVRGKGYDSVIFITDGVTNKPGNAAGGAQSNTYSLLKAQEQADALADEGANVIPIFIGENKRKPVWVPGCKSGNSQGTCNTLNWQAKEGFYFLAPENRPRGVDYENVAENGGTVPSSEVTCHDIRTFTYNKDGINLGTVYAQKGCYRGTNNFVYTIARATPEMMAGSLSQDGRADVLDNFDQLTQELKEKTAGCASVAPDVQFRKLIRAGFDGSQSADANTKEGALDLGNDNNYGSFNVEFEVTNVGNSPVTYLELTDRQLEVENSQAPESLRGLRCGDHKIVLSENDTKATVTLTNPLTNGNSLTCTIQRDIAESNFHNPENPIAVDKYYGNEATLVAKVDRNAKDATTKKDQAWAKAQANLTLFKSYIGGVPRTVTGEIGQQIRANYNIVLTNDGYVDGTFPSLIDTPMPAASGPNRERPSLKIIGVKAYNRDITNVGSLTAQNELIAGDGVATLSEERPGTWKLDSSQMEILKARHKGNFRLEVTYEVTEILSGDDEDNYRCEAVRGERNRGRGLYNSIDIVQSDGVPNVKGSTRNVCYSLLKADVGVTKKINDQGEKVNPNDDYQKQKANKTINLEPGETEFNVSYVIQNNSKTGPKNVASNNGDFPSSDLVSVKLVDTALDESGNPTLSKVPVKGLSCNGQESGNYNPETGVYTFNPAIPAGSEVTCTGKVIVAELSANDIHDGVHGDEIKVTPTYRVQRDQNVPDSDGTTTDTAEGPAVTDKAWVGFPAPATFSLSKTPLELSRVVDGSDNQQIPARYSVSVRNESKVSGTPGSIIENPTPLAGFRVVSIKATNSGGSTKLLNTDEPVKLEKVTTADNDSLYKLDARHFNKLSGNDDRWGSESSINIEVLYEVEDPSVIQADSTELECSDPNRPGMGLHNEVYFEEDEENSDDACISLMVPKVEVEKRINGERAVNKDEAAFIFPGQANVPISYTVINRGKVEITGFSISDRIFKNGQVSDSFLEIRNLNCEDKSENIYYQNSSARIILKEPMQQGESITCSWAQDNGEYFGYDDNGYHANRAKVSAEFQQSNQQESSTPITDEDDAWAYKVPENQGSLPDAGGWGVAPYWITTLLLFAGALLINRRQRKV